MATFQAVRSIQCRDENDAIRWVDVKFELTVDTDDLFNYLGHKALRNKTKKTKEVSGAVVVTVIRDIPKGFRRTGY